MIQILPSINVQTFEEAQDRIKKVEPYVSWCHLDVTDGVFSKHPTWHNPQDLPVLQTALNVEVHLMIAEPEKMIEQWLVKPVKRVIVHLEAARDVEFIIKKCHEVGVEIGLAINPDTFWGRLEPWLEKVDMVQTLAVTPGPSGQKMGEETLDKVRHLRTACPGCRIEVDGGVNKETARQAIDAGADMLVAGSYLFNSLDIKVAIDELSFL